MQTFVYEATKGLERKSLWQYLLLIKKQVGDVPWLLSGNFNVVQSLQEKWDKGRLNGYENEFVECLRRLEILDLSFTGWYFTWNKKRAGVDFVACKFDRVMENVDWVNAYGQTSVEILEGSISDHSPAIIMVGKVQSLSNFSIFELIMRDLRIGLKRVGEFLWEGLVCSSYIPRAYLLRKF